jgi:CO/xanthine dehydrogenase FAD-binding subunit
VQVPRPREPRAFAFLKVSRVKPKGVSVLSIAAHLPRDGGRLRGVRIAFGAMGPMPLRAQAAERILEGAALDAGVIARAAAAATDGLDPPTDALASAWYRREVAGVHLRRLLERML